MTRFGRETPAYLGDLLQLIFERAGRREGAEIRFLCPIHDDHNPSARWNLRKLVWFCDVCGTGGGFRDLAEKLELHTGAINKGRRRQRHSVLASREPESARNCSNTPIPDSVTRTYLHAVTTQIATPLPPAFHNRGFTQEHRATLSLLADGDDGLFPLLDPEGRIVAIKKRWASPRKSRYVYVLGGKGNPPWCSPGITDDQTVIIIEGELNGMVSWLALDGSCAVIGTAGTNGSLRREPLNGKCVYVYADDDEPGAKARQAWSRFAYQAGAQRVFTVAPWPGEDACDVAARDGLDALRERLT